MRQLIGTLISIIVFAAVATGAFFLWVWLDDAQQRSRLIISNDDGRIHVSGPAWRDEAGSPQTPTVYVRTGEGRWEVEILADRYEERRPKQVGD